jgi:hypothetical protein
MGLAASDPDRADRSEDRVDADGSDDAADPDRADRSEDRVDTHRSDDPADTDRSDGSEDRIDQQWINVGHAVERDRVPYPIDGAVGQIDRALGRGSNRREGKCG